MGTEIYTIQVILRDYDNIFRVIECRGETSLYELGKLILHAFNFHFNHFFGFYNSIRDPLNTSSETYTLFYDIEDGVDYKPWEKSVKLSNVDNVFFPGKKFHFQYDDCYTWEFVVECLKIYAPAYGKTYPCISQVVGAAPEQYPESSEEETESDDD